MVKSTGDIVKSKRPVGAGEPILVRLQPDDLAGLDAWRIKQKPAPTRPEAIRQLLKVALPRKR